jgi:hypothetical protein
MTSVTFPLELPVLWNAWWLDDPMGIQFFMGAGYFDLTKVKTE